MNLGKNGMGKTVCMPIRSLLVRSNTIKKRIFGLEKNIQASRKSCLKENYEGNSILRENKGIDKAFVFDSDMVYNNLHT